MDRTDPTLELIWNIDSVNKRIRTKIPYEDLEVYVARLGNTLISGVAVNYNMKSALQLEMLGFTIDKQEPGICEGLALFNNQSIGRENMLEQLMQKYVLERHREYGIRKAYGTCGASNLRGYQALGFRVLDQRSFGRHTEYLICLDYRDLRGVL